MVVAIQAFCTQLMKNFSEFLQLAKDSPTQFRKQLSSILTLLLLIYMFLIAARPSSHDFAGINVQDGYDILWKKLFPDFKTKVLYSSHQISHFEEWSKASMRDSLNGIKQGTWQERIEKPFAGEQYEFPSMMRNFHDITEVQGTKKLFDVNFGWHRIFEGIYPIKIISESKFMMIDPSEVNEFLPRCSELGKSKEVVFVRCP